MPSIGEATDGRALEPAPLKLVRRLQIRSPPGRGAGEKAETLTPPVWAGAGHPARLSFCVSAFLEAAALRSCGKTPEGWGWPTRKRPCVFAQRSKPTGDVVLKECPGGVSARSHGSLTGARPGPGVAQLWSRAAPGEGVCLAQFRTVQTAKQAEALRLLGHSIEHKTRPTVPKSALQTCPLGFPPRPPPAPCPLCTPGRDVRDPAGCSAQEGTRRPGGRAEQAARRRSHCLPSVPHTVSLRLRSASPALALLFPS